MKLDSPTKDAIPVGLARYRNATHNDVFKMVGLGGTIPNIPEDNIIPADIINFVYLKLTQKKECGIIDAKEYHQCLEPPRYAG